MKITAELYEPTGWLDGPVYVSLTRDGRRPLAQLLIEKPTRNAVVTLTPRELRELAMAAMDLAADLRREELEAAEED